MENCLPTRRLHLRSGAAAFPHTGGTARTACWARDENRPSRRGSGEQHGVAERTRSGCSDATVEPCRRGPQHVLHAAIRRGPARPSRARALRRPGLSGLAVDVAQRQLARRRSRSMPNTMGRCKRRGPIEPGLNTVRPRSRPMKGTCEWPHTTSLAPARRARRAASARSFGPVDRDVHQQQLERALPLGTHVEGHHVGQARRALVDVAAHRDHGREPRELGRARRGRRCRRRAGSRRAPAPGSTRRSWGEDDCACRRRSRARAPPLYRARVQRRAAPGDGSSWCSWSSTPGQYSDEPPIVLSRRPRSRTEDA